MSTATQHAEATSAEPEANKLFRMVMKHKGSDLHLKVGLPPAMRLGGVLRATQMPPLTMAEMQPVAFAAKMALAKVLAARRKAGRKP